MVNSLHYALFFFLRNGNISNNWTLEWTLSWPVLTTRMKADAFKSHQIEVFVVKCTKVKLIVQFDLFRHVTDLYLASRGLRVFVFFIFFPVE